MRARAGADAVPEAVVARRWRALAVCLVAAFMTLLDVSIVNVALPSIHQGLRATSDALQWILSGYALTFGLVLVAAGRLGDARSRRAVFTTGLGLFTVASAVAGAAPSIGWLVAARLVQGLAGGLITPQTAGLIQTLFRGEERGRAFGALGAVIGLATAAGPLIGGVLIAVAGNQDGWRWVFYVNLPVGLVALPLAWRLLPSPRDLRAGGSGAGGSGAGGSGAGGRRHSLDPVGVALLGLGVLLLLLPFVQEQQWRGAGKWLLLPAAALVLACFAAWERRHPEPMVNLELFRLRSYRLGAAISLLYFAGFTGIFFAFTLYLQNGLRYSALLAGLAITPFALGSAAAAMVGGRIVARYGRQVVAAGLVAVVAGLTVTMLAVHLVPGDHAGLVTAAPLLAAGVGSGLVISPNQTITLSEVPPAGGGSAAGVLQTGQRIGTAVGIAAAGAVYFATLSASGGDWALAFQRALAVVIGFVLIALCAALADLAADRRAVREQDRGHAPEQEG
ncbi:MFS family permease [Thermocatellispora tengchongensis]|uniref:MFS family permease n=1 Tax=Thermocatellispora tengchongensis TaxID=1073253 RepID=A0A840P104_9ACTN|nr:MFS transporter [Thermocatellispora tengchongensis]MBB5132146.1 MFS family permease [Thermocatellispora tengchongensis]